MDQVKATSNKMGILVGESGNYKTTLLFHYGYFIIEDLIQMDSKIKKETEENIHGVIIFKGNQNKLEQNTFYFGKYSEVFIGHLRQIKLKYVKSYEDIVNFLIYFRFIEPKPKFLFIDEPSSFLSDTTELKLSKLAFLYSLLRETAKFIPTEHEKYFKILVAESIKFKELENNPKDKENLSVFQKYFTHMLAVRSKVGIKRINQILGMEEGDRKEFLLRRIIYDPEADEKNRIIQGTNYSDAFLEQIFAKINESLSG